MDKRLINTIAIAAVFILIGVALFTSSPSPALSPEGYRLLLLVLCAIILWMTNAIPVPITCLLLVAGFYYLKIMETKAIFAASSSNALFFLMAGFGIGAAMMQTNIAYIMLRFILSKAGKDTGKIIIGFTVMASIISLIVSDGTSVIIVAGFLPAIMKAMGDPQPGSSRFLKGLMMCIPMGSMAGGLASPASNSLNVTIMDLMKTATGVEITFLDWCKIGVPLAIILTIFTAWWIPKAIKAEKLTDEQVGKFNDIFDTIPDKLESKDYKFMMIVLVLIVLWVSSNWIKSINVTMTALIGVGIMALPCIGLLSGRTYIKSVQPLGMCLLLTIMPLASAMKETGAGEWLVNTLFMRSANASSYVLYFMIAFVILIIHVVIPSGPSSASVAATIMFPVATAVGMRPVIVLMILALMTGTNYLMPIEGVYSQTFCYDHYSFTDTVKVGWLITILVLVMATFLVPVLIGAFGL